MTRKRARWMPARLPAVCSGVALLSLTLSSAQRPTGRIDIERPLSDERFVARETVTFKASFRDVTLQYSFRSAPSSANPKAQAIIEEIVGR